MSSSPISISTPLSNLSILSNYELKKPCLCSSASNYTSSEVHFKRKRVGVPLTQEEIELRINRRKQKNRVSATNSRLNKEKNCSDERFQNQKLRGQLEYIESMLSKVMKINDNLNSFQLTGEKTAVSQASYSLSGRPAVP